MFTTACLIALATGQFDTMMDESKSEAERTAAAFAYDKNVEELGYRASHGDTEAYEYFGQDAVEEFAVWN